jgi:hypothetical protein
VLRRGVKDGAMQPPPSSRIAWPDGCQAAASFTFDVDGESVWLAMDPANDHRPR